MSLHTDKKGDAEHILAHVGGFLNEISNLNKELELPDLGNEDFYLESVSD